MDEQPPYNPFKDSPQNPSQYPPHRSSSYRKDHPYGRPHDSSSHQHQGRHSDNTGDHRQEYPGQHRQRSDGSDTTSRDTNGRQQKSKQISVAGRAGIGRRRHALLGQHSGRTGRTGEHLPRRYRRETPRAVVRSRRKWTLMFLYAALAVEMVAALLTAPALAIQKVEVTGIRGLPETERTETLKALTVPRATNWILTPLTLLTKRTEKLPWIQGAAVQRNFSRTLRATITPRIPTVAFTVGTDTFESDAEGIPMRAIRTEMRGRLPEIVLPETFHLVLGQSAATSTVQAAIHILQTTDHERALRISKIVIDQNDNLCLNMLDGMRLELGQPDEITAKIAQMQKIYAKDATVGTRLEVINLSCPSAPACTPRLAAAPTTSSTTSDALEGSLPPASNVIQ